MLIVAAAPRKRSLPVNPLDLLQAKISWLAKARPAHAKTPIELFVGASASIAQLERALPTVRKAAWQLDHSAERLNRGFP
jgi:hypothetical protein